MTLKDLDKMIDELKGDLRAAQDFRPVLLKRFPPEQAAGKPKDTQLNLKQTAPAYGATVTSIRNAIAVCGTDYSIYDIEAKLIEAGVAMKRDALSQALSRMKKDLKVKTPASGRKPTIFTKEEPAS